ncbi:ICE-like protease (caspase) p20 domain protein [Ceratobasidium sp. AG-Ba]|nr:ICE-like protease (caspase) p20 domain protein [Ceratobasidium sp. AG-Ba]
MFGFKSKCITAWRSSLGSGNKSSEKCHANTTHRATACTGRSPIHGLIIGINHYPNLPPLSGAVADAEAVREFLIDSLEVPSSQVISLHDEAASRSGIIDAFHKLKNDVRIQKGDPLVIFYAGHGGSTEAHSDWRFKFGFDKIQVIFPYDYRMEATGSEGLVNCIPDQTIRALLNQLAAAKGDNIVGIISMWNSRHNPNPSADCDF